MFDVDVDVNENDLCNYNEDNECIRTRTYRDLFTIVATTSSM